MISGCTDIGFIAYLLQLQDYNTEHPRVLKSCTTMVEVCEGFALFARGNSGRVS